MTVSLQFKPGWLFGGITYHICSYQNDLDTLEN